MMEIGLCWLMEKERETTINILLGLYWVILG